MCGPTALPRLDLFEGRKSDSDVDAKRQADVIETRAGAVGLAGKVVEIRRGPTVTQFGIEAGYMDHDRRAATKHCKKYAPRSPLPFTTRSMLS